MDAEDPVERQRDHRDPQGAPGGGSVAELSRKHGISEAKCYKWRSKVGGMEDELLARH